MAEKEKHKKNPEALGISGFTLGIVSLVMVIFVPLVGIIIAILGATFCYIQQKKHPTKTGKVGLILNIAGFLVNIIWWMVMVKYIYPFIQEQLQRRGQLGIPS